MKCNGLSCTAQQKISTVIAIHYFLDCKNPIDDESELAEIIYGLKIDLPVDGIQRFNIDRQAVWEDSVAAFKNLKFNDKFRPHVRFLGEAGIDAGGLSREYGLILRKEIFSSNASLFDCSMDNHFPPKFV